MSSRNPSHGQEERRSRDANGGGGATWQKRSRRVSQGRERRGEFVRGRRPVGLVLNPKQTWAPRLVAEPCRAAGPSNRPRLARSGVANGERSEERKLASSDWLQLAPENGSRRPSRRSATLTGGRFYEPVKRVSFIYVRPRWWHARTIEKSPGARFNEPGPGRGARAIFARDTTQRPAISRSRNFITARLRKNVSLEVLGGMSA